MCTVYVSVKVGGRQHEACSATTLPPPPPGFAHSVYRIPGWQRVVWPGDSEFAGREQEVLPGNICCREYHLGRGDMILPGKHRMKESETTPQSTISADISTQDVGRFIWGRKYSTGPNAKRRNVSPRQAHRLTRTRYDVTTTRSSKETQGETVADGDKHAMAQTGPSRPTVCAWHQGVGFSSLEPHHIISKTWPNPSRWLFRSNRNKSLTGRARSFWMNQPTGCCSAMFPWLMTMSLIF